MIADSCVEDDNVNDQEDQDQKEVLAEFYKSSSGLYHVIPGYPWPLSAYQVNW